MSPPAEKKSPLPSDVIGEILSRLPMKSLSRFRSVCKPWNKALWEDKCFLNKYLAHTQPQFVLRTNSQICSVAIINLNDDFSIEVRDITTTSEIRCRRHTSLLHCDGFLLSSLRKKKGFAVWNPWLRHKRLVVLEKNQFRFCGVGYDNKTSYKIFGYDLKTQKVAIYDCKSHEQKFINAEPCGGEEGDWRVPKLDSIVSLSGNVYWISYDSGKTREHFIRSFDFSKEIFKTFCILPSFEDLGYTQVLAIYKGDRFSVIRQSYMTNEIEILVTKEKIEAGNGKDVVWMKFMTVLISNFPRLQPKCLSSQPSYFLDDDKKKRLFVCTCDETGHACIYIVKEDVYKKIPIDVDDLWPSHLTYIPSLFIPPLKEEKKNIKKKRATRRQA